MQKKWWWIAGLLVFIYLLTHLVSLTALPVFADESIYIRWSQLIITDWHRYLFFPLNDGKTPLFIWLLVPFELGFKDPLLAGRLLAVTVGALQVLVVVRVLQELEMKRLTQVVGAVSVVLLPFWYFHHRMALMDGLLTLFISFTFLQLLEALKKDNDFVQNHHRLEDIVKIKKNNRAIFSLNSIVNSSNLSSLLLAGFSFALALLTKVPAVLFIPSFYLLLFLFSTQKMLINFVRVTFSLSIAFLVFLLLKLNPAFGQLFSRGGDFLFSFNEVVGGAWQETLASLPNYLFYFFFYLTPTILILSLVGLFMKKNQRKVHVLFWSAVFFIFPIALMGKTVYPRYLFPASFFFTLSFAVSLEGILDYLSQQKLVIYMKVFGSVVLAVLLANTLTTSLNFILLSISNPNLTPFVSADRVQYLTEWSSGHGIKETHQLIKEVSSESKLAVATEGYFGTLPDALLMYLYNDDVSNLLLEGVGYPIIQIPLSFRQKTKDFDTKWLVVNSHRMKLKLDQKYLVSEYCRPFNAPCLQVWDITNYLSLLENN